MYFMGEFLGALYKYYYICSSKYLNHGEMAEWLNAAVLKTVKDASPSGVRIPVSPQVKNVLLCRTFLFPER